MDELISRQAAIEDVRVMQTYKLSEGDDMLLVDQAEVMTELMMLPSAQPEIIRCKDCKHRPYKDKDGDIWAPNWDDETCPCLCEDCYYNWMPEDDFFCKRGERK